MLNLITFLGSRPIGTQGINAEKFAETREVTTGSWLGAPYQRHGLGTEQRAAVLELAFRGLGAVTHHCLRIGCFTDRNSR